MKQKKVSGKVSLNFMEMKEDHNNWLNRAQDFKSAANLIATLDDESPPLPFYFNAGLSLELLLKAIAVAKKLEFKPTHRLNELCDFVGIKINTDQKCTLELLSEVITWGGRYPVPNKEGQWINYHDVILEKHIRREWSGKVYSVTANRKSFPTLENYQVIWSIFEARFVEITKG